MNVGTLAGLPVYITPDRPRYRLPDDMLLPEDFRREINEWAARFFRPTNMLKDGEVYHLPAAPFAQAPGLYMNPRTWAQVRSAQGLKP